MWMSSECEKHRCVLRYHCALHPLSPKPQLERHVSPSWKRPVCTAVSARALPVSLTLASQASLPPPIPHEVFQRPNGLLVPCPSLEFVALLQLHETESSGGKRDAPPEAQPVQRGDADVANEKARRRKSSSGRTVTALLSTRCVCPKRSERDCRFHEAFILHVCT